ncbi:PAS sensor protein [Enterobacter asburiae]|uniref:PAS sensor protein n=1 Tax=Enterobacter asburiae TaxID=61645 RepID=A0A376FJQ2_ENTAS|nr:PAS sensor protein [Enterobacter asburiae]
MLLAVGKVDQFSPSLPYGVLSSAFRTLTLHLLGLPAEDVAKWKIRLSRALEGHEALAVSLVPELGLLLESKPRFSADTFSIDARARFSHIGAGAGKKPLPRRAARWCWCSTISSGATPPACIRSNIC